MPKTNRTRMDSLAHRNYSGVATVPGMERDYEVATACFKAGALAFAEAFKEWCARDFKSSENIPEKFALAAAQELMHEFIQHMSQPGKEGDE